MFWKEIQERLARWKSLCSSSDTPSGPSNPNLIYDVGMHTGQDTEFYLAKGFNVIAIEANPLLMQKAQTDSIARSKKAASRSLTLVWAIAKGYFLSIFALNTASGHLSIKKLEVAVVARK
jgi:hypothetical protein